MGSRLPYAAVHEFGGHIAPNGGTIRIKRSAFIGRALNELEDTILREVAKGVDDAARRKGWR